ncbi:mab-3 [Pristionchus pacificus]|uniref:Uncharacterized protein n=1 Tax=Pristionchus pacificus TaxID=54126 RepID=A0A2A6CJ71_PRIPA|nr:mab-3 [Pristionchus pacificus]|eukprot:PDM78128.1 hypothetical protein PRIPAC_30513 [Pristionchus pacificus]
MDSSDPTLSSLLNTVSLNSMDSIDHFIPLSPPSTDVSDGDISSGEEKDIEEEEKKYYCQRCLNHDLHYPRKGHKNECKYANCPCPACAMVEQRRQLNNMIGKKSPIHFPDPKCARCQSHGVFSRLRGHKKEQCMFSNCNCEACQLVDSRRNLMARQIRLRRNQKKIMQSGGTLNGRITKRNPRSPPLSIRINTPKVTPIRPIPLAPSLSICSLSPSINSISPTISNSSSYSVDSLSPPIPQLFNPLHQINPSFLVSLRSPIPPPPPPPTILLTPALIQYLILQTIQNNSINFLNQ